MIKKLEILRELPKCETREVGKRGWKNGADRSARCRAATNLQSVKTQRLQSANPRMHLCHVHLKGGGVNLFWYDTLGVEASLQDVTMRSFPFHLTKPSNFPRPVAKDSHALPPGHKRHWLPLLGPPGHLPPRRFCPCS